MEGTVGKTRPGTLSVEKLEAMVSELSEEIAALESEMSAVVVSQSGPSIESAIPNEMRAPLTGRVTDCVERIASVNRRIRALRDTLEF